MDKAPAPADPRNQYLAAGVVSGIATVSIGTVLGFSAILLPQLSQEMELSKDEASWIAALSNIGQLFGAIGSGVLAGKLGRKPTLMLLCAPLLAGWLVIGLAPLGQVHFFYLGRVLQGVGVMSSVTQVYLVEIADTERRGMFGASGALSVSVGITLTYCLGALLHWRLVCVACGLLPILVFITMLFMPETPPWLVLKGRDEDAAKTLQWLRGPGFDVSPELAALRGKGKGAHSSTMLDTLKSFRFPGAYKPFLVLIFVFIFQQLSGSYAVIFYAVTLFKDIGVSTNPYVPAIVTGAIRLTGTLIGTALIKRLGRKPLMTVSALLMGFFMGSLAVTVYLKEEFYQTNCLQIKNGTLGSHCLEDPIPWEPAEQRRIDRLKMLYDVYPATAVILYMLSFGAGVGTVPWLLLGELCPSKTKGISSGVTVFIAFISIFAVVKFFPVSLDHLGPPATYAMFALVSVAMAVFTVLCVPETRGRSLAEIQSMYGELGDLESMPPVPTVSGVVKEEGDEKRTT